MKSRLSFAIAILFSVSSMSAFADCISNVLVFDNSDPADASNPTVTAALDVAVNLAVQSPLFPLPPNLPIFQLGASNNQTGKYAIYNIWVSSQRNSMNPSGPPIYEATLMNYGVTSNGYPPAESGCPMNTGNTPGGVADNSGGTGGGGGTGTNALGLGTPTLPGGSYTFTCYLTDPETGARTQIACG